MPKIRKYENWFGEPGAKIHVSGQVFYDAKKKEFCIRVDNQDIFSTREAIAKQLKTRERFPIVIDIRNFKGNFYSGNEELALYGVTEKEAEDHFHDYMKIYVDSITNRTKVIMYQFKAEIYGEETNINPHYVYDPGDSTEIELTYKIAIETQAGGQKAYLRFINDDLAGGIISNYRGEYKIIPYTQ
ncbi:hypothetical protein LCGC14_2963720, partial [marine sediment metagenome]